MIVLTGSKIHKEFEDLHPDKAGVGRTLEEVGVLVAVLEILAEDAVDSDKNDRWLTTESNLEDLKSR